MNLVNKAFGEIINFSRASAATRINASGLIESVAANQPRFDYDPATLQPRGFLIEEQRTNLLTWTSNIHAGWVLNGAARAPASGSYLGLSGGAEIITPTGANWHRSEAQSVDLTAGIPYAVTAFVKPGTDSNIRILMANMSQTSSVQGSLLGTLTTLSAAGVFSNVVKKEIGTGFVISAVFTPVNSGGHVLSIGPFSVVAGGSTIVYGAQLEAGAYPTSYIPTAASQVTRAADVATINTLSPWFTAGNGVIYLEHSTFNPAPSANRVLELSNGGTQERIYIAQQSATTMRLYSETAGSAVVTLVQSSSSPGVITKTAARIKSNDFAISTGGLDAITDIDAPFPAGLNVLRLGSAHLNGAFLNGHIRKMRYYPKGASNAELKSLTA